MIFFLTLITHNIHEGCSVRFCFFPKLVVDNTINDEEYLDVLSSKVRSIVYRFFTNSRFSCLISSISSKVSFDGRKRSTCGGK